MALDAPPNAQYNESPPSESNPCRQAPSFTEDSSLHPDVMTQSAVDGECIAQEAGAGGGIPVGLLRGGLWHVVDDEPVAVAEMLQTFAGMLGAKAPRRVPRWLARLVAGEIVVRFMTTPIVTWNRRLREQTGWTPRFASYREGLDEVVAAWRTEGLLRKWNHR
jgi:hypothetical protein